MLFRRWLGSEHQGGITRSDRRVHVKSLNGGRRLLSKACPFATPLLPPFSVQNLGAASELRRTSLQDWWNQSSPPCGVDTWTYLNSSCATKVWHGSNPQPMPVSTAILALVNRRYGILERRHLTADYHYFHCIVEHQRSADIPRFFSQSDIVELRWWWSKEDSKLSPLDLLWIFLEVVLDDASVIRPLKQQTGHFIIRHSGLGALFLRRVFL